MIIIGYNDILYLKDKKEDLTSFDSIIRANEISVISKQLH